MRKLVYAINTTLDGCCDHTKFGPDEDTFEYVTHLTRAADTFLWGRTTYQLMVPYWPDVAKEDPSDEFAQAFDAVEKIIVFSKSLDRPEGEKTRIVRADLRDEVLKLKQEQGKDIMTGGVTIPLQLAELGLIDEYYFLVHPIVVGEGRRVFEGIDLQATNWTNLVHFSIKIQAKQIAENHRDYLAYEGYGTFVPNNPQLAAEEPFFALIGTNKEVFRLRSQPEIITLPLPGKSTPPRPPATVPAPRRTT